MAPTAAPEQTKQHVSPSVSVPVDTHLANPENVTDEIARTNDHLVLENGDKSAFHYNLAFENVTDEIACTDVLTKTTWLEPVLQLQNAIVSIDTLNHWEGIAQAELEGLEVAATSHSPAIQSHPSATVIPHRCPIITRDLEVIQ